MQRLGVSLLTVWLPCKYRVVKMEQNRLPKLVFFWDFDNSITRCLKNGKEACGIL